MRLYRQLLVCLISVGCSALDAPQTPATRPAMQSPRPAAQTAAATTPAIEVSPPRESNSVLFAIIGDSGTGGRSQYEIGALMTKARQIFPFEFVIMLGDNIYGSERPQDFVKKFEKPYEGILSQNIPFYASST
jgi:hypothetical protein